MRPPPSEAADDADIRRMMSDRVAGSTEKGYKGKGLEVYKVFLKEERRWARIEIESNDVFEVPQSAVLAARLCVLYAS